MAVDFIAFFAKLIIALIILKLIEVHMIRKQGEDSPVGQALAFLVG